MKVLFIATCVCPYRYTDESRSAIFSTATVFVYSSVEMIVISKMTPLNYYCLQRLKTCMQTFTLHCTPPIRSHFHCTTLFHTTHTHHPRVSPAHHPHAHHTFTHTYTTHTHTSTAQHTFTHMYTTHTHTFTAQHIFTHIHQPYAHFLPLHNTPQHTFTAHHPHAHFHCTTHLITHTYSKQHNTQQQTHLQFSDSTT